MNQGDKSETEAAQGCPLEVCPNCGQRGLFAEQGKFVSNRPGCRVTVRVYKCACGFKVSAMSTSATEGRE